MVSSCCHNRSLGLLLCAAGACVSAYALFVETKFAEDPTYRPMCDIDEGVSCSVAFNSSYGRGFGLVGSLLGDEEHVLNQPNPVYGLAFYGIMALLALFNIVFFARLQLYLSIVSNLGSVYLAYILYFVLENLCVVCVTIYAINFLLLVTSACKLSYLKQLRERQSQFSVGAGRGGLPTTTNTYDFKKNI